MAKKRILYPTTEDGSLIGYPYSDAPAEPHFDKVSNINWIDNIVFEDTLTFTGYGRGRSSAVMHFEGSNGASYNMFLSDTNVLLKTKDIIGGKVKAQWTFCKRGSNFGIKLSEETMV